MTFLGRGSRARKISRVKLALCGPMLIAALVVLMTLTAAPATTLAAGDTDFVPASWGGSQTAEKAERATSSRSSRRASRTRAARAASNSEDDGSRPQRRSRVAATSSRAASRPSLTGGSVNWIASSGCLAGNLRSVIATVAARYGGVTVNSTCRDAGHNRRVGGASKSWHLTGNAADIRVHGNVASAASYMRGEVGGYKHYGGGRFHIDNGPTRSF
jgi:uncharacterized protein YcbK (DUF882 family)